MKRILYLALVLVASTLAVSCGLIGENQSANDSDSLKLDSIALGNFEFNTKQVAYKDSLEQNNVTVYYDIALDVPISGQTELVAAIKNWMNKVLGGSYTGECNFSHEMFTYYANLYFQDCEDQDLFQGHGASNTIKILQAANTDKFVSYVLESYEYTGGAHGMPTKYGVTFVKENGERLGWDIFADTLSLTPIFKKGVAAYLVEYDKTPLDEVLFDNARKKFPLPTIEPWLVDSGVSFVYGVYEIMPYACGMPSGTISTKDVKKFLSKKAIALLSEK